MNVYHVKITGFYPIGGDLIVIDETKRKALNQAKKKLASIGLSEKNKALNMDDIYEIPTDKRDVIVINDGSY